MHRSCTGRGRGRTGERWSQNIAVLIQQKRSKATQSRRMTTPMLQRIIRAQRMRTAVKPTVIESICRVELTGHVSQRECIEAEFMQVDIGIEVFGSNLYC